MADKQEANLAPLGKLILVNGQLSFIPSNESNFSVEFFGLPEVAEIKAPAADAKIEEIEEENRLEEENPGFETSEPIIFNIAEQQENKLTAAEADPSAPVVHYLPVEEQEEEPVNPIINETIVEEQQEENKTGRSFFTKFLIVLLVIAALGAIAYFINPQFFNRYFNKNYQGQQDQHVPSLPNDTLKNEVDTPKLDSLTKNNSTPVVPKDTAVIDSTKLTTFEVFVSAVKTEKMADKIIANLAKENIKAKKIRLTKSKISISAGTFLDKKSAVKYRDSLRIKLKNEAIYEKEITPNNPKK